MSNLDTTSDNNQSPVELNESNIIWARHRMDCVIAVSDALTVIDRNGYTDELYKHSILRLMETVEVLSDQAKEFLKY